MDEIKAAEAINTEVADTKTAATKPGNSLVYKIIRIYVPLAYWWTMIALAALIIQSVLLMGWPDKDLIIPGIQVLWALSGAIVIAVAGEKIVDKIKNGNS